MLTPGGLNESHQRRLLASARYADKLLSEIEAILAASESKSPFPKYRPDVSLHQARLIRAHIARFRDHLVRVLAGFGIETGTARFGSLHSIRVNLTFVRIAVQEMGPGYLRGYGAFPEEAAAELRGLCAELEGLIDGLERNLALGDGADLQARLTRLDQTVHEADLLKLLDQVVSDNELAEFRGALLNLVDRLESPRFEAAVFGRVSSGKSSLLNHILATEVLPVGVNPITAVPTRIAFGERPSLTVTLADRQVKKAPLEDLVEYASEERNPGNSLGVVRLEVELPSPRLSEGLVLVDTPGLGSLATAGAAETLSYLPQCDLGIVLISAVSALNEEDLNTVHALSQAGIPVMALLSKADLLSPADREKAAAYTQRQIQANLGLQVDVHPVSTVGDDQRLLETWFREELARVFERHRELASQSVRRKTGALRESVIRALRAKLGQNGAGEMPGVSSLEETELALRTAAGEIEQVSRECLDLTNDVRRLGETALAQTVERMLNGWPRPADVPNAIRDAAESLAAEASARIAGRLTGLARQLQTALKAAAAALRDDEPSPDGRLEQCVRGMPRFDAAIPEAPISPPWFGAIKAIARPAAVRKLRRAAGGALEAGFVNYARALELWCRSTLREIQQRFDERADAYRAQLGRLISAGPASAEDRERALRQLAALENWPASAAGGVGQNSSGRPASL
jgi:GTPase Era involved in 16S rRNA processing